jgi:hypothetical protein
MRGKWCGFKTLEGRFEDFSGYPEPNDVRVTEKPKKYSRYCNARNPRITILQPSTKVSGIAKGGMYV